MLTDAARWLPEQKKARGKVANMPLLWNKGPHPQKSAKRPCTHSFFWGKASVFTSLFYVETSVSAKFSRKTFSDHQYDRGWS